MTVVFLIASLLGLLFSDMARVVDCHAGVLGSNPGGPKRFSPWNYFTKTSEKTRTSPLVANCSSISPAI